METPACAQLQREIHDALLAQHPDWILPTGECPTCDSYDARFAEAAEGALAAITEQYFRPNLTVEELRALIREGANADPLKLFAEACRAGLKSMHTAL